MEYEIRNKEIFIIENSEKKIPFDEVQRKLQSAEVALQKAKENYDFWFKIKTEYEQ
jgi:hypothetical protein